MPPRRSKRPNKGKHNRYPSDEEEDQRHKRAKQSSRGEGSNHEGNSELEALTQEEEDVAEESSVTQSNTTTTPFALLSTNNDAPTTEASQSHNNNAFLETAAVGNVSNNYLPNGDDQNNNDNNCPDDYPSPPTLLAASESERPQSNNNAHQSNEVPSLPPPDELPPLPAQAAQQKAAPSMIAAVPLPPPDEVPHYTPEYVKAEFERQFPIGRYFNTAKDCYDAIQAFQNRHYCRVRKQGRQGAKCSCSANTHSRAKDTGMKSVDIQEFSMSTDCKMEVRWSQKKTDNGRVSISFVNGFHNHPCNLSRAANQQKLSGRDIKSILPIIAIPFAPHLQGGRSIETKTARTLIRSHLGDEVQTDATTIATIVAAVKKYIDSDEFNGIPQIDSNSMVAQFRKFVTNDTATEDCSKILKSVITNSSSDTSWIVYQLMEELKRKDPEEFDYRMHKDKHGNIDAVCWQTGVHRAAFLRYGNILFLDARKKDTQNVLGLIYMTLVVIDANNKFWPICHAFVFEETHDLYEFACNAALSMTPGRTRESVVLGYGDLFFERDRVKMWFPNILMMIDAYHLIHMEKPKSVMAKDFGSAWSALKQHMINALKANSKDDFLGHIDKALAVAGNNQVIRDKIVTWQNMGDQWAYFSRNTVPWHRFVATSNYAEQNHWSIAANAPDDPNRSLEQNIVDIMERDKTLFDQRQEDAFRWDTLTQTHLSSMTHELANDLANAREALDEKPYAFFVNEYKLSRQYHVVDAIEDGVAGSWVRHISQLDSGAGRFIRDGERCNLCNESVAMTMCRHDIAKSKHQNMPVFDKALIDPVHLRRTITPRARVLDGTYVSTVRKMPGHQPVTNDTTASHALFGGTDNDNEDIDFGNDEEDTKDAFQGTDVLLASSTPKEVHSVLASPSKQLMPPVSKHADGTSTRELKRSIPFNTLLKQAQDLANLVGPLCPITQHAYNTHLLNLMDLFRIGDYSNARHDDRCVASFAHRLVGMGVKDKSVAGPNMPKQRAAKKSGRKAEHRLGSAKSHVSSKPQRKCGFCKSQGQAGSTHKNKSSCPVKDSFGEYDEIKSAKDSESIGTIVDKLDVMLRGENASFRDMSKVLGETEMTERMFLEAIPDGTKRIQVKGYHVCKEGRYVFCVCIDNQGRELIRNEGKSTTSYVDIFIHETAVKTRLNTFDYVFWKSLK